MKEAIRSTCIGFHRGPSTVSLVNIHQVEFHLPLARIRYSVRHFGGVFGKLTTNGNKHCVNRGTTRLG